MFKLREFLYIIIASAVLGYVIAFSQMSWASWLRYSIFGFIVLIINVIAKKFAAYKLGCEAEIVPWQTQRYWFYESAHLKYPFPMWLVWPIFVAWISLGTVWWLVVTTFEVYATRSRVGRKFAELTEWDVALISAAGIVSNLILAVIAASLGHQRFAFINLWFVFFNLLPFPAYDGGKIFFGEMLFYVFLATVSTIVLILLHIPAVAVSPLTVTLSSLLVGVIAIFVFYAIFEKPLK